MKMQRVEYKIENDIIELFAQKIIDKEWSFANYKPSETSKWTHSYHRYPAKFIPQLVEKLLDEYIKNDTAFINDPFMGSGTTIVSALSNGFIASGTDINRIAHLITKVKSTPIEPELLTNKLNNFRKKISFLNSDNESFLFAEKKVEPFIPNTHLDRIKYWFKEENIIKLGQILRIIYQEENQDIQNFLLVAFSHILKNCSIWLQKSTKPTRDLKKKVADPYRIITRHLKKMQRGNNIYFNLIPSNVKNDTKKFLNIKISDAKHQPIENNSVDLIVTSSPYVTSYEYADLHQLSSIWLDLVDDLKEYKKEFIGTSYKGYNNKILTSDIAKKIVEKMSNKNRKKAKEIEAFFIDMQEVIQESFRILKINGRACYVIGNTSLRGVSILNAEVFAEIMINIGFKLDRIIKREIPSKILPQKRDAKTGRFAKSTEADNLAYPCEYILIGKKE